MKTIIVVLTGALLLTQMRAQTNAVMFPQLLSTNNSVLMTNAEFRTCYGNQILFKNESSYQHFSGRDLSTNVLAELHVTVSSLEEDQIKIDAAKQKFNANAAKISADERRKQAWIQNEKDHPLSMYGGDYSKENPTRKGWDGRNYHDNQSSGNFIGN